MTSSRRTSVNAASASPRAPRVPPVPTTTTTRSATRTSARRAAARPAVEQEDVEAESGVPPTQPRATPSPATAGKRRAAPKAKRHATPANGRATKRPKPSRAAVPADASPTPSDDDTEDVVVLPCPNDPGRAADDFLRRFAAGAVGTTVAGGPTVDLAGFQSPPPTSTTTAQLPHAANDQAQAIANLEATVQALTATVATLANAVAAQAAPAPQPFAANSHTIFNLPAPAMLSRTAPSGACVYPTNDPSHPAPATLPANFFTRTTPSFEYPSTKIKGEYYPSPSHVLAAQRLYRAAHPADGTLHAPHSFVLSLYASMQSRYRVSPALVAAVYSGRLGSKGASIMCLTEIDRSAGLTAASASEVNIAFNPGAALPPNSIPKCQSMMDLVNAVSGLCNFALEHWFDHGYHLASALRRFVLARNSATPTPHAAVLERTLNYVDMWLGNALNTLDGTGPEWWTRFNDAVRAIDVKSPEWLVDLVHANTQVATPVPRTTPPPAAPEQRRTAPKGPSSHSRSVVPSEPMPEHIRALIPKMGDNEPCLRHFSGNVCGSGEAQCKLSNRLHEWPEPLPAELLQWARSNLGLYRNKQRRHRNNGHRA